MNRKRGNNKIHNCIPNASATLTNILQNQQGFRNETYIGSNIRNLQRIIIHELKELNNRDIFYTMKKFYSNYKNDSINGTLDFISKLLNCMPIDLEGIWLTGFEECKQLYCNNQDIVNNIQVYKITDNMIPISDLGKDGILFAYNKKYSPQFFQIDEKEEIYE